MKPLTLFVLCAANIVSACTLGPDYERARGLADILGLETAGTAPAETFRSEPETPAASLQGISHWWERLGDPGLAPQVARLLANNNDLAASGARVLQAQARLDNVTGTRFPSLDLSPGGSRAFTTSSAGNRSYANSYTVGASLSWQTDLFGRLRRSARAEAATLAATRADWQGLVHTQIATLVRTRVALATLQRRLEATRAITESRRATLNAVERRYRAGLETTNAVDLHLARENFTSAMADIPSLENDLSATASALDILLGQWPGTTATTLEPMAITPPPRDVLVGVPASLLDRRPDLQAAEFRLIAATERVGVAMADLYPNLTLTASGTSTSPTVSNLFDVATLAGSLTAQIAQSVFDGGARRATVRQREAATAEQAAIYAGTILNAIKEVEDALVAERKSGERLAQLNVTLREIRLAESNSFDRFRRGIGSYATLLETQRRLRIAEQNVLRQQQDKWNTRLDLLLALGGDWVGTENYRPPTVFVETQASVAARAEGKPNP
ncbi:MAG: hypothetical protein COA62_09740 [Rhodobiaceae bacterium]|nr:MAG: hypothetical protein COA62_09740 [Rhodobiaceae bacterium]